MDLHVTLVGRGDLSAQIYRQLSEAILDGRLRPGERLPPSRVLAQRLDVSRNTVAAVYDQLSAEGFLAGQVGAGTYVSMQPLRRARPRRAPAGHGARPRRIWAGISQPTHLRSSTAEYDFTVGVPDGRHFPLATWRRLVTRELRASTVRDVDYGEPAGHAGLRRAIARHIGLARSVRADAEDVIVTQGAQQAIDLIGRVLVDPGGVVAMEEPGYPPVRELFRSLGARVMGVAVDAEGLDVGAIPRAARLVYTTPSHQYPLGTPMSLARRAALLAWAEHRGGVVIEDDYDSEFRFSDRPLEPIQSLDRSGRVIYVGSFSKTTLPMLRLGFLVAPASLRPTLRTAKWLADWHGETPTQAAMAQFIDEGLLARHIRKASRDYANRHERIVAILRRDFVRWLDLMPSAAGLHLCARLSAEAAVDVPEVVRRAATAGVRVHSLATFCGEEPAQHGLVLGYGAIPIEKIPRGLELLATAFRSARQAA